MPTGADLRAAQDRPTKERLRENSLAQALLIGAQASRRFNLAGGGPRPPRGEAVSAEGRRQERGDAVPRGEPLHKHKTTSKNLLDTSGRMSYLLPLRHKV